MKTIYLEPAWKLRKTSYIQAFFLYPPDGYRFMASMGTQNKIFGFLSKFGTSFEIQNVLARLVPIQLVKSYAEILKHHPKEPILTYALDHLVLRKEPWILENTFELPWILCGSEEQLQRFKNSVKKALYSDYLKKITFQLEIGKEAFIQTFGEDLKDKTEVIYRGEIPKDVRRDYNKGRIKLLFVNTANISGDYIFYVKGGAEVIEAFLRLQEKYKDNIELDLRTSIPRKFQEKLPRFKNVKVIEHPIPWYELEEQWKSADIFLHPHHGTPPYTLLDAMSYGLPIVTTDTWGTPELVEDGKTGFLVHNPKAARFTDGPIFHLTNSQYKKEVMKGAQSQVVEDLVEKICLLIENPDLRHKMGERAKEEVETGKHSIETRNGKLKGILDEVTGC